MIEFSCANCGRRIRVPDSYAAKKGKCPSCKTIVVVQKVEPTPSAGHNNSNEPEISARSPLLDPAMFDVTPEQEAAIESTGQTDVSGKHFQESVKPKADMGTVAVEPALERKHPWLVDIFLYPANLSGLTTLGIFVGIPLLFRGLVWILGIFALAFPPMLVFLVLFAVVGLIVRSVLYLYLYWYVCECIRDSAQGGLRAPETMAQTPGVGDMFFQLLKILSCLVLFWGPVVAWGFRTFSMAMATTVYWGSLPPTFQSDLAKNAVITASLLTYAVFFFPMALLAVVMFDSLCGLNPVLIIRSIFSTFVAYCGLVLVFCVLWAVVGALRYVMVRYCPLPMQVTAFLLYCAGAYLLLVKAHILGRFYWNKRQILDWET